jgi:hypothetical protein
MKDICHEIDLERPNKGGTMRIVKVDKIKSQQSHSMVMKPMQNAVLPRKN